MLKDEKELDFNEPVKDTRKEMDFDANKKPIEPKKVEKPQSWEKDFSPEEVKRMKNEYEGKQAHIDSLTKAGFSVDPGYKAGNTYSIIRKNTGSPASISIGPGGKYFRMSRDGGSYTYKDLPTAIDRALFTSGKAPHQNAVGWETGSYNQKAEDDFIKSFEQPKPNHSAKFDKLIKHANNTYFPEYRGEDAAKGFIEDYEFGNMDENYNPGKNYKLTDDEKSYITEQFKKLRPNYSDLTDDELKEELYDNQYWYGSAKSVDEVAQRLVDRTKISPEKAKEFASKYWKGDETWSDEEEDEGDDFYSPDNIIKRHQKIEDAFEMPKEEGWEPSNFGEKSFIKNKDTDNEMFIQYNGSDYDGNNQEWVAGYMKNGEYIDKKFGSMEQAKEFLDNADLKTNEKDSRKQLNKEFDPEYQRQKSEDRELFNKLGQSNLGLSVEDLNDIVAYIRSKRNK